MNPKVLTNLLGVITYFDKVGDINKELSNNPFFGM